MKMDAIYPIMIRTTLCFIPANMDPDENLPATRPPKAASIISVLPPSWEELYP